MTEDASLTLPFFIFTGSYNMSMGIELDSVIIWTGWATYTADPGPPTSSLVPLINLIPVADYLANMEEKTTGVVFVSTKI